MVLPNIRYTQCSGDDSSPSNVPDTTCVVEWYHPPTCHPNRNKIKWRVLPKLQVLPYAGYSCYLGRSLHSVCAQGLHDRRFFQQVAAPPGGALNFNPVFPRRINHTTAADYKYAKRPRRTIALRGVFISRPGVFLRFRSNVTIRSSLRNNCETSNVTAFADSLTVGNGFVNLWPWSV